MAIKMDHTGAGDITLDTTAAGELRVDTNPVLIPDETGRATGDFVFYHDTSQYEVTQGLWTLTDDGSNRWYLTFDTTVAAATASTNYMIFDSKSTQQQYIDFHKDGVKTGGIRVETGAAGTADWGLWAQSGFAMLIDSSTRQCTFAQQPIFPQQSAISFNFNALSGTINYTGSSDGDTWFTRAGNDYAFYTNMNGVVLRAPFINHEQTWTSKQTWPTPTASIASMNLPHGTAPTTPVDGDMWTTTSGVFARVNGSTVDLTAGAATLGALTDVDLTGAADNDLLFRSGGNWIDTAGDLTWDASILSLGNDKKLRLNSSSTGSADLYFNAGSTLFIDGTGPGILTAISTDANLQFTESNSGRIFFNPNYSTYAEGNSYRIEMRGDNTVTSNQKSRIGQWTTGQMYFQQSGTSTVFRFGGSAMSSGAAAYYASIDSTQAEFSVPIEASGGSAAAPGIAFSGETNTGFYRGAANEFSVSVLGVERATFTNAGTIFDTDTAQEPVYISRLGGLSEALAFSVNDSIAFIDHIQDEVDATVHETRLRTTTSSSGAHRVTIYENSTESHRFYTGGEGYYMFGGGQIRVYDSTNADFLGFAHDGTDANISCGGTTDMNFTSASYYKFDNSVVQTETSTTRGISMDTLATDGAGIKRITWNDGAGNWNINANTRYSAGQIFASAGAAGQLRFDSDAAPCVAYFRVSNNTTDATQDSAVTWGPGITITGGATGQIDFDGTAYFTNTIYPQGQTVGQITAVSGSFGSIEVTGADGTSGTWSGYSIGGEVVFMSNLTGVGTTNRAGLYDDINNAWIIQFNESQANREIEFCYAGTATLRTTVRGIDVNDTAGSDPTIGFYNNSSWGTEQAFIQSQDTGNFIIRNVVNSGIVYIQAYDSGGTSTNCVISDPNADVSLYYDGIETFRTATEDGNNMGTGAEIRHADQSFYPVGMNVSAAKANPGSFSAAATWLDYMGHTVIKTNTTAFTATTPGSTDGVVPNGGIWNFLNFGGTGNITIAAGSGVTLTWMDGTGGSTGSRTIADGGVATLWKRNDTNWYIWGNGIS